MTPTGIGAVAGVLGALAAVIGAGVTLFVTLGGDSSSNGRGTPSVQTTGPKSETNRQSSDGPTVRDSLDLVEFVQDVGADELPAELEPYI
jgi:hypothetical protein